MIEVVVLGEQVNRSTRRCPGYLRREGDSHKATRPRVVRLIVDCMESRISRE